MPHTDSSENRTAHAGSQRTDLRSLYGAIIYDRVVARTAEQVEAIQLWVYQVARQKIFDGLLERLDNEAS